MARTFHLSCNGPLDTADEAIETLSHALSRLINDPRVLDRLLEATILLPCRINTVNGTLAEARAMDAALMSLGLFSEIFVLDSHFPDDPGVFINERLGSRRGPPPTSASAEPIPAESDGDDQREKKGRRSSDR